MRPLTRITNKHLLPIYDRPMVTYAIEAFVKAGISEIMLVTGGTHAGEFLRLLGNGEDFGVGRLLYSYQDRPGGIAEALGLAEKFVGNDKLAVILADNIFGSSISGVVENFTRQPGGARIVLVGLGEPDHLSNLGVARFEGDKIVEIQEKPDVAPSSYAVTGLYFYDPTVFEIISNLTPSERGELEITDVNNYFVNAGSMEYDILDGYWGDAGESIDAYFEVNDYVRANGANK